MDAPQEPAAVAVRREDLPLYCPNPAMPLWSSHPRVYLNLDARGETMCPYCGTKYKFGGPAPAGH